MRWVVLREGGGSALFDLLRYTLVIGSKRGGVG